MPGQDLFANIRNTYQNMTKAEKKVADYLLENPGQVLYMSITDFARNCGVGDTSVFRFCKTLQLAGYQDFKMQLAQSISIGGSAALTLSEEILTTDSIEETCHKLAATNISALNQTLESLQAEDVHRAIRLMEQARAIHFVGVGSSAASALEGKYKFARILPNVVFEADAHMQAMSASLMGSQDVVIAFSYSGSTKETLQAVRLAKQNYAKIICITHFEKSPFAGLGDVVLLCGAHEGPFQGGSLSAKISQLFLVDVLYTEYFKQHYRQCDSNKKRTTSAVADKLL